MSAIYVWWIGADAPDQVMLDGVRAGVSRSYELPARLWHGEERPADTWDPRRGQHSSTQILRWLAGHRPAGARKVLAITDVDLFIPVLTFVYGEAQLGGHAAVVSTARLWAGPDGRRLVRARLVTESVHELGHSLVTWFAEHTPLELILRVRPQVLVKGGDLAGGQDRGREGGHGLGRRGAFHPLSPRPVHHRAPGPPARRFG